MTTPLQRASLQQPEQIALSLFVENLFETEKDQIYSKVWDFIVSHQYSYAHTAQLLFEISTYPDRDFDVKGEILTQIETLQIIPEAMNDLTRNHRYYEFIYIFSLFSFSARQRIIEKIEQPEHLLPCVYAILGTEWDVEEKQFVMGTLYEVFDRSQLESFIQHQARMYTPVNLVSQLQLVSNRRTAQIFAHSLAENNVFFPYNTLIETIIQSGNFNYPYSLEAILSLVSQNITDVYLDMDIEQKALVLLCTAQNIRTSLIQKTAGRDLSPLFNRLIKYQKEDQISRHISLSFIQAIRRMPFLFRFLSRLPEENCKQISDLFPAICRFKLQEFAFSSLYEEDQVKLLSFVQPRTRFLHQVLPDDREKMIRLIEFITPNQAEALMENAWLDVTTSYSEADNEAPPTFPSILEDCLRVASSENADAIILPYQSALQQIPNIILLFAYKMPARKTQLGKVIPYLSDSQLCALAKMLRIEDSRFFIKQTLNRISVYFPSLSQEIRQTYLTKLKEEFNQSSSKLIQQFQEYQTLFSEQKNLYDSLIGNKKAEWEDYQTKYVILLRFRNALMKTLHETQSVTGRLEFLTRLNDPNTPQKIPYIESIKTQMTLFNAEIESLNFRQIHPPIIEEENDNLHPIWALITQNELTPLNVTYQDLPLIGLDSPKDYDALGLTSAYINQINFIVNTLTGWIQFKEKESKKEIIDKFYAIFSLAKCVDKEKQIHEILLRFLLNDKFKEMQDKIQTLIHQRPETASQMIHLIKEHHPLTILQRYSTQQNLMNIWQKLIRKGFSSLSDLKEMNPDLNLFSLNVDEVKMKKKRQKINPVEAGPSSSK